MSAIIQTFTGLSFDLLAPTPDMIRIVDIARALSHKCRFNGHTVEFYSVAEHSCRVSDAVAEACESWGLTPADRIRLALIALLHDSEEGYGDDVVLPYKLAIPEIAPYLARLDAVRGLILSRYIPTYTDPTGALPVLVREFDARLCSTEKRDLLRPAADPSIWAGQDAYAPLSGEIRPWSPLTARFEFLARFARLTGVPEIHWPERGW